MAQQIFKQRQPSGGRRDEEPQQPLGIQTPGGQQYIRPTGNSVYDGDTSNIDEVLRQSEALKKDTQSLLGNSSASAQSASSLQAAEQSATESIPANAVPSDQVGKGYTGTPKNTNSPIKLNAKGANFLRTNAAKKWGVGVIISLVIGGGGVGVVNIASGPAEFIHMAKLMEQFHFSDDQDFMDDRGGRVVIHAPGADGKTNLGKMGNKIADHYEDRLKKAGITPGYANGRIKTLTIDTKTPEGKKTQEKMRQMGMTDADLKPNSQGIVAINIDKNAGLGSARYRRVVIKGMVGTLEMNGVLSAIATRKLQARAGVDLHPLKNIERGAQEKIEDYRERVQKEREERIRNGVEAAARSVQAEANNNEDDPNAGSQNETANNAASEANDLLGDATNPNETVEQRSARIKGKLTAGVGVTGYLSIVCGVQVIGNEVGNVRYANVILPLIRVGIEGVAIGNQIMSNRNVNADELGAFHEGLYDPETKKAWSDARSIQAEMNQDLTGPDMPESAKPGNAGKPGMFKKVDDIIGGVPGGNKFCSAVTSTVGGWVLSAAGIALSSTGVGAVINVATEVAQTMLVNGLLDDVIKWIAGDQISMTAKGAIRGNYVNYGSRLAANDLAISHGGRALNKKEEFELVAWRNATNEQQQQSKSFYARYLDLNETNSLAARVVFQTPALTNKQAAIDSASRLPSNVAAAIALPFNTIFTKTASAGETKSTYDYGFDKYGFSLGERDDPRYENPYANAAIVEPKLAELNETYGECFATTVEPTSFRIVTGQAKRYDEMPDKCKDANNEDLTRYRFYLADVTVVKTMACYEDLDEAACDEMGFGSASANSSTATGVIDMPNLYKDSTQVACAPGTHEIGKHDGYHGGKLIRITVCRVPGFASSGDESNGGHGVTGGNGEVLVNSRVSGAYLAMFNAAKADGITLKANSSFRTMANQQKLYAELGPSVAAKPGYSNHQMGLAIDFAKPGTNNTITAGDQTHDWLKSHAETYGIKPYLAEDWHWSPTGT